MEFSNPHVDAATCRGLDTQHTRMLKTAISRAAANAMMITPELYTPSFIVLLSPRAGPVPLVFCSPFFFISSMSEEKGCKPVNSHPPRCDVHHPCLCIENYVPHHHNPPLHRWHQQWETSVSRLQCAHRSLTWGPRLYFHLPAVQGSSSTV